MDDSDPRSLSEAVGVRRQVRRGLAVGVVFAGGLFALFVLDPGATRPTALYLALAAVVALTAGALFATVFVAVAAYRLLGRESGR